MSIPTLASHAALSLIEEPNSSTPLSASSFVLKVLKVTAYHPQTDGQTERQNQELETFLRIWVNSHQNDWATWLPSPQFCYNNLAHSTTGISPSTALFGMPAYDGYNTCLKPKVPAASEFAAMHDKIREEVKSALCDSKTRMKEQYDKHVCDTIPYACNQLVWLSAKNIKSVQPSKKLTHLCCGPFRVIKKISTTSYKITIPLYWKEKRVHDVFHADLLCPYVTPYFKNQVNDGPIKVPDMVEDDNQEDT
ncbi:unnamed protein product [Peniophora sp. CBMAI 1063]|nr:unnamed protein product [Peniophora sp. CBMAI 1063]